MPNLAFIFDMRERPTDPGPAVARMTRVLDVPGVEYTIRSWRDDRFGGVNLLTGTCDNLEQPAVDDRGTVLFLDGEIVNLEEVWRREVGSGSGGRAPSAAQACLDLYCSRGEDFVAELNGQFNVVVYEPGHRRVRVFNDRLGYRSGYYWFQDGVGIFALEMKAIFVALGRTPPMDPMGMLEFIAFQHSLNDHTVFGGVRVMTLGTVLEFHDGKSALRHHWRPEYKENPDARSLDAAARELSRRLCDAMARWTRRPRRYGIFLSGGLDSRAVAGALAESTRDVTSFTFGSDRSPDLIYGRGIAERLGFSFHRLRYEDVSLVENLPRVVWRVEGSIPFNQPLSIAHHAAMRANAQVIFNGHFGGAASGCRFLPGHFIARNPAQLTKHILATRTVLQGRRLRSLFNAAFFDEAFPEMSRRLERTITAFGEDRMPIAYQLWEVTDHQARFTFRSSSVDRYVVEQVTPFTDRDVADWMMGLPLWQLVGQRVYKRMLVEHFPAAAAVPWSKTGRAIPSNFALDMATQGWRFATKRLRKMVAGPDPAAPSPLLTGLDPYLNGDLVVDALPQDVFDPDGVRRMLRAAWAAGQISKSAYVLMTLAECIRLFGSQTPDVIPPEAQPVL